MDSGRVHVSLAPHPPSAEHGWLSTQDVARRPLGARACARSPSLAQRFPGQGLASSSLQSDGAPRCHLSQPWPSSSVRWVSSAHRPGVVGGDQPRRGCMVLGGLLSRAARASSSPAAVARSDVGQEDRLGGRSSDGPLMVRTGKAVPVATETGLRTGAGTWRAPQTCQHLCLLLLILHACPPPAQAGGNEL